MPNKYLPYDPGNLPSSPVPQIGEKISFNVEGYPPQKDVHFSIRNSRHKNHSRFVALRKAAIIEMAGHAPYRQAVRMDIEIHAPKFEDRWTLNLYCGGIMDTLDGSHGERFTYLPIVYEDDCQVAKLNSSFKKDSEIYYVVNIEFLA